MERLPKAQNHHSESTRQRGTLDVLASIEVREFLGQFG